MAGRLLGKTALITGAGSGMGRAMAQVFAAEGASIAAVDLRAETAEETTQGLQNTEGTAIAIEADVSDASSVSEMVEQALAEFDRVDILCNNAGVLDDYKPIMDTSEELWDLIMGVNLKGMFLVTKALIPHMLENDGGVVVNTSSIAGFIAGGGGAAYTSSKHGVLGFTRQLAFDYGGQGIRANAVCPGAVETGMTRELLEAGDAAVMEAINSVPAGRYAQPEEVAQLALYLASDDSSFVHGAAMLIDGGWTVK